MILKLKWAMQWCNRLRFELDFVWVSFNVLWFPPTSQSMLLSITCIWQSVCAWCHAIYWHAIQSNLSNFNCSDTEMSSVSISMHS